MPPQPPLPEGWELRRSASNPADVYYYNRETEEATRQRPAAPTAHEVRLQTERAVDAAEHHLVSVVGLDPSSAETLAEYFVAVWEQAAGASEFAEAIQADDPGCGDSGLTPPVLQDLFHLLHVAHPKKKRAGALARSKRHRERGFDPDPPPGWHVAESSTRLGAFYYVNDATGESSVRRPDADSDAVAAAAAASSASGGRGPRRGDRYVVTDVEPRGAEDVVPPFLRAAAALQSGVGLATTRLTRNPQGALAKAAALPSALIEVRRKDGGAMPGGHQWEMPSAKEAGGRRRRGFGGGSLLAVQLPIHAHKGAIVDAVRQARCLVVIGETGSGKTTQIPQYVWDCVVGRAPGGVVACTQPRRVSAISIAKRVAAERGGKVGDEVGYAVRFDERCGAATGIKYMTDGMLLREFASNPTLRGYSVVMVDEAHERTVTSDLLLYLLNRLLQSPDGAHLRVLISSATIDAKKFSAFFFNAAVFYIPGRTFPVETLYVQEREEDWYAMCLKVVFEIHAHEGEGDILVFLTGQDEIDLACQICYEWYQGLLAAPGGSELGGLVILPLYSSLPAENQTEIFERPPEGSRKVIFATNIAETSITIDGIVFVVDCGFAKIKTYDPVYKMDCLVVAPIAQSAARQRAGRAGRTGPGKCFRLYTEETYDAEMLSQSVPEIQRSNLETTVLMLKQHTSEDIWAVEFLDPLPANLVRAALHSLYHLGALDDAGAVTAAGRELLLFPLLPHLAKLVLCAARLGCAGEACAVVALLTCGTQVFNRPRRVADEADAAHRRLALTAGDHATLLNVFCRCHGLGERDRADWCRDNFVSARAMEAAVQVAAQLSATCERAGLVRRGGAGVAPEELHARVPALRRAVCEASVLRVARRHSTEQNVVVYKTASDDLQVAVHPTSVFARLQWDESPEWVAYDELVQTRREYLRTVTPVEPDWLAEAAPKLYHAVATEFRGEAAEAMRKEVASLRGVFGGGGGDGDGDGPDGDDFRRHGGGGSAAKRRHDGAWGRGGSGGKRKRH